MFQKERPYHLLDSIHTAIIDAKVKGGSFDRPYSVASDGTIDLERISLTVEPGDMTPNHVDILLKKKDPPTGYKNTEGIHS